MKVSINWLKELVDLKIPIEELVCILPLKTIAIKELTPDYFELDMKGYNRADLLSLRGIALEIAAIADSKVKFSEEEDLNSNLPKVDVTVENAKLTPVYCIAKIENLKVEHSDETWVKKLNNSGFRSVNNIADITNLIMLEYGQPLHAFDASQVKNETIIVRCAKAGEKLMTLDEKNRDLTSTDLLITDSEKPLGLAGVMGGKNSEIKDNTSTILLEAAIFDSKTLRKTATRLGLISEASKRFYHGLTKKRLFQALTATIKMYEEIGGKLTALTIVDSLTSKTITIDLSHQQTNTLIGIDIPDEKIEEYLKRLYFGLEKTAEGWKVTPPYFRLDIEIAVDVIEEIARMYGYEKIPAQPLNDNIPKIPINPIFEGIESLKNDLFKLGLDEVQTYSYYSTKALNALGFDDQKKQELIKVANPISSETEYLRDNLWPNLVEVVGRNIRQGLEDIAIFEIGKVYFIDEKGEAAEKYHLAIALMNNTDNPLAELSSIANKLKIELKKDNLNLELFHPNRVVDNLMGEVHKRITDKLGINQRVAVLEIAL